MSLPEIPGRPDLPQQISRKLTPYLEGARQSEEARAREGIDGDDALVSMIQDHARTRYTQEIISPRTSALLELTRHLDPDLGRLQLRPYPEVTGIWQFQMQYPDGSTIVRLDTTVRASKNDNPLTIALAAMEESSHKEKHILGVQGRRTMKSLSFPFFPSEPQYTHKGKHEEKVVERAYEKLLDPEGLRLEATVTASVPGVEIKPEEMLSVIADPAREDREYGRILNSENALTLTKIIKTAHPAAQPEMTWEAIEDYFEEVLPHALPKSYEDLAEVVRIIEQSTPVFHQNDSERRVDA